MIKVIKVKKYGIIHAYAQCDNCDWTAAIDTRETNRMQKLRNKIYAHVKKTGHRVTLETGNSTTYSS